ncbi:MAG: hypothetical protein EA408_01360 [Marinilabiliales bacterium]|nr:MAG: hypothetical protein EA408_01360 [Marinilabiliales bacterium]
MPDDKSVSLNRLKVNHIVMEGFFETFIYLIITVVILVLSMRKKKQPVQAPEDEEGPGDPLSELFSDEDEQEEYQPAPEPATVQAESSSASDGRPVQWMSDAEAKEMLMDAEAVMKEAAENNPIAEFEGQTEPVEDDAYDTGSYEKEGVSFNLKKAVIYSEILGRRT